MSRPHTNFKWVLKSDHVFYVGPGGDKIYDRSWGPFHRNMTSWPVVEDGITEKTIDGYRGWSLIISGPHPGGVKKAIRDHARRNNGGYYIRFTPWADTIPGSHVISNLCAIAYLPAPSTIGDLLK